MMNLGKVERGMMEQGGHVDLEETKKEFAKGWKQLRGKFESLFIQKGISLLIIGFLLGRALILSHFTPFALPFFAAVYVMKRDKAPITLLGLTAGGLTLSVANGMYTLASTILFILVFRFFGKYHKEETRVLPFYIFAVSLVSKCAYLYLQQQFQLSFYDGLMAGVESCLTFILTMIFMQSIPILSQTRRKKH